MLLDKFLPAWDFREKHSIDIDAAPPSVLRALRELTPADVPLVSLLMGFRALPGLIVGRKTLSARRHDPYLQQIIGSGFLELAEEPGKELLLGTVGQFWKPLWRFCPDVQTPEEFHNFHDEGWVKVGWNFVVRDTGKGAELATETRIAATDRISRRKFRIYWTLIRPGSGLLRRVILSSLKKKVEQQTS